MLNQRGIHVLLGVTAEGDVVGQPGTDRRPVSALPLYGPVAADVRRDGRQNAGILSALQGRFKRLEFLE